MPKKVIVADDDAAVRKLVQTILEDAGYIVEAVSDGLEALTRIDQDLPDLFISDINMPEVDGLELVEALRKHQETHEVPVIILSASEEADDFTKSIWLGAQSFIRKPFDTDVLLHTVTKCIGPP